MESVEHHPVDRLPGLTVPHTYDQKLRKLTIRNARIFPKEIFAHAEMIEVLDMAGGQLRELPNDLGRLEMLRIAFFSGNPLGAVPKALAGCPALEMVGLKSCQITNFEEDALPAGLRGLILTDNNIPRLPSSIGKLASLQKLMLAGNALEALPPELAGCRQLQLLRLPANALAEVPDWLWELPSLGWYSDASNPLSYRPRLPVLTPVPWQQLEIEDKLGESAKNVVYRATWRANGQKVAVKLFGKGLTTDGLPQDEMQASGIAGAHPSLIPVIGEVTAAPQGQAGLVMALIPSNFKVLGSPPDLVTLTRDTSLPKLTVSTILSSLQAVCSALRHLHRRGIMHGDVYAHNLLVNSHAQTYMGDLGAASLYDQAKDNGRRERIDVRGFGYLLGDILAQTIPTQDARLSRLFALRDGCLGQGKEAITRFDDVESLLSST